jgi:hypothetical protein
MTPLDTLLWEYIKDEVYVEPLTNMMSKAK